MLEATVRARWRIYCSPQVLAEADRVLVEKLGFSQRFGQLTREHIRRRAALVVPPASRHEVARDPADSPILTAALAGGADLLVTNDAHLLALNPYEGLRIIAMSADYQLLIDEGHMLVP
jgi:predicted nucleic acid-binding protein